jgi:hypothetical protein
MALDPNTKIVELKDEVLLDVFVLTENWRAGNLYWQREGIVQTPAERESINNVRTQAKAEILRRMGAKS